MAGKLDWHGPEALARIRAELARRLARCLLLVVNRAKELISIDGTGGGGKRKLRYGANPSRPGEPPHLQTGQLRGSVAWESDGLQGRAGTNLVKGKHLELGTRKMAARPWLRRALSEVQDQIKSILSAPMKGP